MAQETNQTQVLCSNGCGFYGNPRNNGMCSVCYKDSLQRRNNSGRSSDPGESDVFKKRLCSVLLSCKNSVVFDHIRQWRQFTKSQGMAKKMTSSSNLTLHLDMSLFFFSFLTLYISGLKLRSWRVTVLPSLAPTSFNSSN